MSRGELAAPGDWGARARALAASPAVRFVVVGGFNTVLGYALLWAFLRGFAGLPYAVALANGAAYAVGIAISFASHRRWTFRSRGSAGGELPRFIVAHLGALAVSSTLMQAGVSVVHLPLAVCFLVVAPVTTLLNYVVQRRWVFAGR